MNDNPSDPTTLSPPTRPPGATPHAKQDPAFTEPYLIIVSGNDRGKHHKLQQPHSVVGRDSSAHIVIADPKVSRRHAVLTVFHDGILLEDAGSSNGVFVDGVRIQTHKLDSRQRICLGDTYLRVDYKRQDEADADQALYQAANTDALTSILNRGAFMRRSDEEVSFCRRRGGRLTVVICDVDHFKQVNDTFGHLAGDYVLRELANILRQEVRKEDLLARYGGEEFIVLLREPPQTVPLFWAERVRHKVMVHPFVFQGRPIPTTVSIGICSCRAEAVESLPSVIQSADNALYQAKRKGRNRVEIFVR